MHSTVNQAFLIQAPLPWADNSIWGSTGGPRISLKGGGHRIVCITKDWIKYSGIDL